MSKPLQQGQPNLYSCFDFRLRSEIALPELHPADDPADTRPVVEVRIGAVPEELPGATVRRPRIEVAGDLALIKTPGMARYLVRGADSVTVEPVPGGSARNLRLFLLGSVVGLVAWRRGLLPLHANAIVVDGQAVAFAGNSGAGKSTLAAWFQRAGYTVLCDDVCVLRFDADGRPMAWPGLPRLKLWGDAADAMGHDTNALDRVIEGKDKFSVGLAADPALHPVPLRRLYHLARAEDTPGIVPVRGPEALRMAMEQAYRPRYPRVLGLGEEHVRRSAALVERVELFEARRVWGFDVFEREAQAIARHLRKG